LIFPATKWWFTPYPGLLPWLKPIAIGIPLVVSTNPSEKYDFVRWDNDIPKIWKNKTCSKPPTRNDHPTDTAAEATPNYTQLCERFVHPLAVKFMDMTLGLFCDGRTRM